MIRYCLPVLCVLLLVGAASAADFTANATFGPAPLAVQFTDLSGGTPAAWSWDFGDGNTSTERNPVHTYALPGKYSVSLEAGAGTETKPRYITVVPGRSAATATITPLPTNLTNDLIEAFGGKTAPDPGESTIGWLLFLETILAAFLLTCGPLGSVGIFAIPFFMMWIAQRDMTLPGLAGAVLGLFIIARLPADFHLVAVAFIALSIVATVYSLMKER